MLFYIKTNAISIYFLFLSSVCFGQNPDSLSFFAPAQQFNKQRFNLAAGSIGATYTGLSLALYHTWYKDFDQDRFHFFNDWREWRNVDKLGHIYSAHAQALLGYKAAKWTGMSESKSIWSGVVLGGLAQTTIELMDGFSSKWGFSVSDFGANMAGLALFAGQQTTWKEQRFVLKMSSYPKDYSVFLVDKFERDVVGDRVARIYGESRWEKLLKDYNAQTIWLSGNIRSFIPESAIPKWLNVSIGYGAENIFGGFSNEWQIDDIVYSVDALDHQRYSQFFLSPDIDLTRIKVKKPFWKTVLSVLNIFKLPMPTIEYNTTGQLVWHWLFL